MKTLIGKTALSSLVGALLLAPTLAAAESDPMGGKFELAQATAGLAGSGKLTAIIETSMGSFTCELFEKDAPGTVANFVGLARGLRPFLNPNTGKWEKKPFYDGLIFHRVIPGFMIQGGDPKSKSGDRSVMGTGDPGYKIKAEFNDTKHERGIVSMARSQDPDSAGSQFFICVAKADFLDGKYTAFGKVIEGMDVVDKIVNLKRDPRDNPLEENPAIMKKVTIQESKD